jgi:hypothetical protein
MIDLSVLSGRGMFNRGGRSARQRFVLHQSQRYWPRRPCSRPDGGIPFTAQQALMPRNYRRTGIFQPRTRYAWRPATPLVSGPWNFSWDIAASKTVTIMERKSIEFRGLRLSTSSTTPAFMWATKPQADTIRRE